MDSKITELMAETKSLRTDIAGFQGRMDGLEQRVERIEDQLNTLTDRDQELLHLRSKVIALEDRSRRDNASFFGFPESEKSDAKTFLQSFLFGLTGLTFTPPLELQRVHRITRQGVTGQTSQDR